jgi:hypothetical protein
VKYYVYIWQNRHNGKAYIGKGTGGRARDHLKLATMAGRNYRFIRCGRTNLTYCETVVADNPFHAKMLAELETYK